ncbi:MAG: acyl-CoA dehydratase activase [Candidatus Geothermincolales bacterium]
MIVLGCDMGSLYSKLVVVKDGEILGHKVAETTGDIEDRLPTLVEEALEAAGVSWSRLDSVVATGAWADLVQEADFIEDDIACLAWAARCYLEDVSMLVDIGGQSITSVLLGPDGEVADFMRNDKCASGSGRFLEVMSSAVGVSLDRVDEIAARASSRVPISSQCGVFVESEVVTLVNEGISPEEIVAGLCDAVSRIVASQAMRLGGGVPYTLSGGVARLRAVVDGVKERLQGAYFPLPFDPQLAAAVGAALLAEEE